MFYRSLSTLSNATASRAGLRARKRRTQPIHRSLQRSLKPLPKSAADSPSLAPGRKPDRDLSTSPETEIVVAFDDNRAASALVGPYGQHLALIARRLGVVADSRGNHVTIAGSRDGCAAARRVLETLYKQALAATGMR